MPADAVVVTGCAGGIGSALRVRLEAAGKRVIGLDRVDSELVVDVASAEERARIPLLVADALGSDVLVGVVAAAGVLGMGDASSAARLAEAAVSVNYFGAVATLQGLQPLLAQSGRSAAVAVGSHMATTQPTSRQIVDACLVGAEDDARAAAGVEPAVTYSSTKLALERWVRRHAPSDAWIGTGITLNAVALGLVDTPMTSASVPFILDHPEVMVLPAGRAATASEAASVVAYLLSDDARFFCGSIVSMDGGSDAATRGDDWPAPLSEPAHHRRPAESH
jgi:NAD(P)-dependent dehydrogenase (short-subunit alcohol dehydrogenase family)